MDVHSISLKGRRDQNEDKHSIILNITSKNKNIKNINYFAVYDGHGGPQISTYLEQNIHKYFLNTEVSYPLSHKYVNKIYEHITSCLKKSNMANNCGSTCLIVIQFKYNSSNYINVINTGDSRCIMCRDNFGLPLTKDHKPNWPEERSRISKLGGKIVFDGYDWRINDLSVSRAIGDLDAAPNVTWTPDLFRYRLDKDDKFLVLACDGLWDVLSNSDVVNFILNNCYDETTKVRINKNINIAKKLAEYAINKGSNDNITIVVIFLY